MQIQLNGETYHTYRFSGGEYSDAWESWHLHKELLDEEGIKGRIRQALQELKKTHEQYLADQKYWEETRKPYVLERIGIGPQWVLEKWSNRPPHPLNQALAIREFVHLGSDEDDSDTRIYRYKNSPGHPGNWNSPEYEKYREWCTLPVEQRRERIDGITVDDFLRVTAQHKDKFDYYEKALELAGFITLKASVEFEPYIDWEHNFLRVCAMVGVEYVP
jgi:hypothetical protein